MEPKSTCPLKGIYETEYHRLLISDNPEYPPVAVEVEKVRMPHLIIGRVIWSWTGWVR